MREINTHKVNGCNEAITVATPDDLTIGGAPTTYLLNTPRHRTHGNIVEGLPPGAVIETTIRFQNGAIGVVGTNGLTHEALTAVVIDRLEGFQRGPYACQDNADALDHYRAAMACLQRRTLARVARGVEGTHEK